MEYRCKTWFVWLPVIFLWGLIGAWAQTDGATIRAWEKRVQWAAEVGRKTVVGISAPGRSSVGSGVIVSADGYILTAAHVTAPLGRRLLITLPDGRVLRARGLGRATVRDAAMVKIEVPRGERLELPFAKMRTDERVKEGEWVVSLGHTSGFMEDRPAPVRLGRVLQNEEAATAGGYIYSDCTLAGGDSGGGLFDLQGRLVGIHSQIGEPLLENLHIPLDAYRQHWRALREGVIVGDGRPVIHIAPVDPTMDMDELAPMMEELISMFPEGSAPRFMMLPFREGNPLPKQAKAFGELLEVFKPLLREAASATVALYDTADPGTPIVMGAIVSAKGHVLTKASEVEGRTLRARLSTGQMANAAVRYVLPEHDLALLNLETLGRTSVITFSEAAENPAGSFLAAPGVDGVPMSIGVWSVKARRIDRPQSGYLGVVIEPAGGDGARISDVVRDSPAAAAGLRTGDVVRKVGRQVIRHPGDLTRAIGDARPGSVVELAVARGNSWKRIQARLANREDSDMNTLFMNASEFLGTTLSARRSDYPSVFQHDLALNPNQVGGPLVDMQGRVVGLNIARAGRTKTYAIPGRLIAGLLKNRAAWTPVSEE